MSQVKGKDTGIERAVRSALHKRGLRFRKHVKELPGKPDVVFSKAKVVVFIDGDFWHGYRLPLWDDKLSDFWKVKIRKNRERDKKNLIRFKKMGWQVIRIWQHELESCFSSCIERIVVAIQQAEDSAMLKRKHL